MGMFDYVKCDYPLPLPDEALELKSPPKWEEVEFQTKSLGSMLDTYTIEEDGQIYKELVDREVISDEKGVLTLDETSNGIERVETTGEIDFYALHMEKSHDYWIEFKALVWKGELKEIQLKEFKKEDNSTRLKSQAQIEGLLKEHEKKIETRMLCWLSG